MEQTEALLRMVQLVTLVFVAMVIRASAATDRVTVMQNVFRVSNGIPQRREPEELEDSAYLINVH